MSLRRVMISGLAAGMLVLAGCGSSPEDKAHDNGKQLGQAVHELYDATSVDQTRAAAADVRTARDDLDSDTRDQVKDEVDVQSGSLKDAADAYQRAIGATSSADADAARQDLRAAVQQIRSQSSSLADQNNSISVAFWDGFRDGYDD